MIVIINFIENCHRSSTLHYTQQHNAQYYQTHVYTDRRKFIDESAVTCDQWQHLYKILMFITRSRFAFRSFFAVGSIEATS